MLQRERAYFKNLLGIFKAVAFHEIYMESARQDLCRDEYYDPLTAFKSMDHFKHNRVIAYELYSFFQLYRIESTIQQCEQIIKSLDKSLLYMDYESFEKMALPSNQTLRNLSKTRYNNVQIGIGSFSRLTYVKEHSSHRICIFLEKEINFYRQHLFMRQEFCRQWGGDVYTLLQKLRNKTKNQEKKQISFEEFYNIGRQYGVIFNKSQFRCIWRRSKNRRQNLQEVSGALNLTFEQLHQLLLVANFNTKEKYALQRNVPLEKVLKRSQPSYKTSHWREHQKWKQNLKKQKLNQLKQHDSQKRELKYHFTYPESMNDPLHIRGEMNNKHNQWVSNVNNMNDKQLLDAYMKLTVKKPLFYE